MKQTKDEWTNYEIEDYLVKLLVNNCYEVLQLKLHNLKIEKSESPDFIINSDNKVIGVEITRALDQNLQKVHSIRTDKLRKISFCPILFEGHSMSKKEIISLLKKSEKKLIGKAYLDDELENKVFENIKKFIKYDKFHQNILFIHAENRVTLEINLVIQKISKFIPNINVLYDYIFLKLGNNIYYFKEDSYKSCKIMT